MLHCDALDVACMCFLHYSEIINFLFCLTLLLLCNCNQELNLSFLRCLSQNSDTEVDVVGAVIQVSPALSERYLLL